MIKESHKGIFKNMCGFSKLDGHGEDVELIVIRELFHSCQMSLSVYTSHEVVVQTGKDTSLEDIMAFVGHHERFVLNRLRTFQEARKAERSIPLFANGEVIKMFNRPYTVERSATEPWL